MKRLPKNTQFFLSSLMEEKIVSHPNDWNMYFKSSYQQKFNKLYEEEKKQDPTEEAKKRLKKEQEEQEKILKQAQADLDRATANAMVVDEPETPETAKSGVSAIGGGYGGGPPAKEGELDFGLGKTVFGETDGVGFLPFMMGIGKAAGMAGDALRIGTQLGINRRTAASPLMRTPMLRYAAQTLGADVGKFLQSIGHNIETAVGPQHALKGAEELAIRNAKNLVSGEGSPFFPIPIAYRRPDRDVEGFIRRQTNQPYYASDLDSDYWRYQNLMQ